MLKKYNDFPTAEDMIEFDLEVGNVNCVKKVTIYHIERGLRNDRIIENKFYNSDLEIQYEQSQSEEVKNKLEETATISKLYYSEAKIVMSTVSPLWDKKTEKVKVINGKFNFMWQPKGMRHGTYLIRWDWDNKSAEKIFTIQASNSNPQNLFTKLVPRDKYNILMDKYIPAMYKMQTKKDDLTPQILVKFNRAIAQGFLEIEDLATQLIDLLDPNFTHEAFLPLLANLFNLELKSHNTNAWRNQIKHCIPLYKQKGTLASLREALDKAGIQLVKLTNLWQIASPYTWIDTILIEKDISSGIIGELNKVPIGNIKIYLEKTELPENYIKIQDKSILWNSEEISLYKGDILKISYDYNKVDESVEKYIRTLPVADQREDTKYPLKNWNVRLIEEDDPLFDLLVKERNPFYNPVVYGKIRTTFLYSENVYNMETYDGSLYNSNNPCDMDKEFIDMCSNGQSSKFNIHLEVNEISDDKIKEAKDIITDYSPFHAVLHNMKISVKTTDLILSPVENIKNITKSKSGDNVAYGESIKCKIRYKDGKMLEGKIL